MVYFYFLSIFISISDGFHFFLNTFFHSLASLSLPIPHSFSKVWMSGFILIDQKILQIYFSSSFFNVQFLKIYHLSWSLLAYDPLIEVKIKRACMTWLSVFFCMNVLQTVFYHKISEFWIVENVEIIQIFFYEDIWQLVYI